MVTAMWPASRNVANDETVTLSGGLIVQVPALRVLWELESRGCEMGVDGDVIVVRPGSKLRPKERAVIQQHRGDVIAAIRYVERCAPSFGNLKK